MKKTAAITFCILSCVCLLAQETQGCVSYSLPRTNIVLTVNAETEFFHAGPYARYAKKFLGIEAQAQDSRKCRVTGITARAAVEADPQARYSILLPGSAGDYLQLSTQGLISRGSGTIAENEWRFPSAKEGGFGAEVMPANLETESTTLFRAGEGSVQQSAIVEKSPEKKAKEAAEMIFKIRDNRYKILVGDTDATYSGEAMKAAVDALSSLEEEYLSLFLGKKEYSTQQAAFDVIPTRETKNQLYIAFRLSDSEGLVAPDNMSGKPFYLELQEEVLADNVLSDKKTSKPASEIRYRIPVICKVTLRDGTRTWFQTRMPVYQLGKTLSYPVVKTK